MFFDTHAHFDHLGANPERTLAMLTRARTAGVTRILAVGGRPDANEAAIIAAELFPSEIKPALGLDRDEAKELLRDSATLDRALTILRHSLLSYRAAAIGEIGLDFYYARQTLDAQIELFAQQLTLARELHLPVIVHSREAEQETISALRSHAEQWSASPADLGVLHCFTGSLEFAKNLLDLGFYISFSGIVTFRNADNLRRVARFVPNNRLLIETDTPHLAPEPLRGHENEPSYLPHIAAALAQVRGCPVESLAEITTANALRLFDRQR